MERSNPALETVASGKPTEKEVSVLPELGKGFTKRRIIAEDPEWNLAAVEKLSNICVKIIVGNFESNSFNVENPVLKNIPTKYRERIVQSISTETPLSIAAPLIPDESYWERRSKVRFKLANVDEYGGSWKRLYFELHLRDAIESFVPSLDQTMLDKMNQLTQELRLAAPFVQALNLRQLKPVEPRPPFNALAPLAKKSDLTELMKDIDSDHVDLNVIISHLINLKRLSLYYGVKDCGINFRWNYFGMTISDSLKLAKALEYSNLQYLSIPASGIDDDRCRVLCHSMIKNRTLTELNLSNNKIGDKGAQAIATVLASHLCSLVVLNLCNNKIGQEGVSLLGKALIQNKTLSQIDLRLNRLGDEGESLLLNDLKKNSGLSFLEVSGNGLGAKSVTALASLLKLNHPNLTRLDISCNKLGNYVPPADEKEAAATLPVGVASDTAGKTLLEAISLNKVFSLI